MLKIVRRFLFSFLCLFMTLLILAGWWHSTREWKAWIAETPVGIFKIQSESSIFGIGGQFMTHEHRWAAFSNSDPITGDKMKWIVQKPNIKIGNGLFLLILPYWQMFVSFLLATVACFALESRRLSTVKSSLPI